MNSCSRLLGTVAHTMNCIAIELIACDQRRLEVFDICGVDANGRDQTQLCAQDAPGCKAERRAMAIDLETKQVAGAYGRWAPVYDVVFGFHWSAMRSCRAVPRRLPWKPRPRRKPSRTDPSVLVSKRGHRRLACALGRAAPGPRGPPHAAAAFAFATVLSSVAALPHSMPIHAGASRSHSKRTCDAELPGTPESAALG